MILTRDGKEITAIYRQNGSEVEEVKDANGRLVYSAAREIVGTLPLRYSGRGKPLTDYLLSGNTIQDGTPSADAPVDATGCGVRTGNLIPYPYYDQSGTISSILWTVSNSGHLKGNGVNDQGTNFYLSRNLVLKPGTYTLKIHGKHIGMTLRIYDGAGQGSIAAIPPSGVDAYTTFTIDSSTSTTCAVYFNVGTIGQTVDIDCEVMLNAGSTALPYEPYGYKLPLTVNGTEYPIYLGEVETTRRVKKLVLTGKERWDRITGNAPYRIQLPDIVQTSDRKIVLFTSSHYLAVSNAAFWDRHTTCVSWTFSGDVNAKCLVFRDTNQASLNDFKSYLAQQYANGTPITVWYVLAEPETAVVNEPLMKIGDYADTVSFAQSQVAIPTASGANVLDMASTVKPSEVYIKGKGIKPTGYGQLADVNGVNILGKDGRPIYVHGQ